MLTEQVKSMVIWIYSKYICNK